MGFDPEGWTPIHEDYNTCIEWGNNVIGGRERAKHIDIRKNFAHEVIQNGHICLVRVDSANQLPDVFRLHKELAAGTVCSLHVWYPSLEMEHVRDFGIHEGNNIQRATNRVTSTLTKVFSCTQ
jgi:hypothetical protein